MGRAARLPSGVPHEDDVANVKAAAYIKTLKRAKNITEGLTHPLRFNFNITNINSLDLILRDFIGLIDN